MINEIAKRAKELGWEVVKMEMVDSETAIVMVYREKAPIKKRPYSVHDFYGNGFYNGRYDLSKTRADMIFNLKAY